jgi:hypothetical protein
MLYSTAIPRRHLLTTKVNAAHGAVLERLKSELGAEIR